MRVGRCACWRLGHQRARRRIPMCLHEWRSGTASVRAPSRESRVPSRGSPSRSRGFMLGAAYGGGMAIAYGILGLVVILTAGSFGTINASPWFNAGIAVLFVALALAMFDVITIDFSKHSYGLIPKAHSGSFVLAFSMGAFA